MPQIKSYIHAILMLICFSVYSQNSVENDPEIIQNNINHRIREANVDIDNYNYYEAQKKLDEALDIAINSNNKKSEGIIYALKGELQLIIEEEDNAIQSLIKAVEVQRLINDNANIGNSYKIFGDVYHSKKDYYQALDQYTAAKSKFQEEELNENLSEVLLCEGKTYMRLKNFRKARELNEQAIALAKRNGYLKIQSNGLVNHGKIYSILGDNEKALEFANEGILIAKKNNYASILNDGYLILSEINQNIGDYKLSNTYLKAHIKLSDSLRVIKRANLSPDKQVQYLMADKNEENKKQAKELEEAEKELEAKLKSHINPETEVKLVSFVDDEN